MLTIVSEAGFIKNIQSLIYFNDYRDTANTKRISKNSLKIILQDKVIGNCFKQQINGKLIF